MSIVKDVEKAQSLALRVFNNRYNEDEKVIKLEDEQMIKKLCSKVFPASGETPSTDMLHEFNNIVLRTAESISEPDVKKMVGIFASLQNVPYKEQMVRYKKAIPKHVRLRWTSAGSSVSFKRVQTGETVYTDLGYAQTGIKYNYLIDSETQVQEFRDLVKDIAQARVRLIYEEIMRLISEGVTNSVFSNKQMKIAANIPIADFNKIANVIHRRTKTRPIFIGDIELINSFAEKKISTLGTNTPDELKLQFYNFNLTNLGSADAIPMENDFVSRKSYDTYYPVSKGYMLGGVGTEKVMDVILAGGLTQETEKDIEPGVFKMIIRQKMGITMLYAENIGYIEDTAVTI